MRFSLLTLMLSVASALSMQAEPLYFRGSLIDWYYYGRDYTGSTSGDGWHQQPTGWGTEQNPYNYGLFEVCIDPAQEKADKFVGMDFVVRNHLCYGNAGGVYTRDAFYCFFMHETPESSATNEEYGNEEWEILVRKWDIEQGTYTQVGRLPAQPTDLTYDPYTDKVYGIFRLYNESEQDLAYELCELNMKTFEVTPISNTGMFMLQEPRAIATDGKGYVYGINSLGDVMKYSLKTGDCRNIGNIGFKTQERMMSACYDFRTDKLYWLGYKNSGKRDEANHDGTNNTLTIAEGGRDTGIYEVSTTDGSVTLLSNCEYKNFDMDAMKLTWCGKIVMTGLWLEGSYDGIDKPQGIDTVTDNAAAEAVYSLAGQPVSHASRPGFYVKRNAQGTQKVMVTAQ